ncbi:MAG: DUF4412 domain-containing protein [Candidatus Binataceae bacterium]
MKAFGAILAAILMLVTAAAAHAGVVVEEQETLDRGNGQPMTESRTVMVEGHKQKTVTSRSEVLIDLDQSSMYVISPERKAYVEMPFPPQGKMGQMMAQRLSALDFKKTGNHKTIAGYPCDEYTGSGNMMGSSYSVVGCFSDTAPGAADFTAFQKAMAAKVHGADGAAAKSNVPSGVPLEVTSTTRMTSFSMPGMTADQAAKVKAMLAKRPPVTNKTQVTKVSAETIAASDFTVPPGYQKQEMPSAAPAPAGNMSSGPPSGGMSNMSNMSNMSAPPASGSGNSSSGDGLAPKMQ